MKDDSGKRPLQYHTGPNAPGIKRREDILHSVSELLEDATCLDISFEDIADNAGLPVSSCYYYFDNKWDVCKTLDQKMHDRLAEQLDLAGDSWSKVTVWPDVLDEFLRRGRGFAEANPIVGELWYRNKVPTAAANSAERNHPLAENIEALFDRLFVLPEIENRTSIFYVTCQILDSFLGSLWLSDTDHDWIWREMNLGMRSYLALYLPEDLPRRALELELVAQA